MNSTCVFSVILLTVFLFMCCGTLTAFVLPYGLDDGADGNLNADNGPFNNIAPSETFPVANYNAPIKRASARFAGPAEECRSYDECRGRFVKYLESLKKMGKVGR